MEVEEDVEGVRGKLVTSRPAMFPTILDGLFDAKSRTIHVIEEDLPVCCRLYNLLGVFIKVVDEKFLAARSKYICK